MHGFVRHLYLFFAHLGPWGLLILGVLDSSFLFMPLGNDLLIIGLTSQHPKLLMLYAPVAAAGSILGCFLIDVVVRKQGQEGLERIAGHKRMDYLKKKIGERAAFSLALASLAPPPFPFTPFVAAASAFAYPRPKMFTVIGVSRLIRFTLVGLLAVFFGRRILRIAQSPIFEGAVIGILALFLIGSVFSILKWVQKAMPPRLPLGDAYTGECRAGAISRQPEDAALRTCCNTGYARGICALFPHDARADAVRFSIASDLPGEIHLQYIFEKACWPLQHGDLTYSAAGHCFTPSLLDEIAARQAAVFMESYLRRTR